MHPPHTLAAVSLSLLLLGCGGGDGVAPGGETTATPGAAGQSQTDPPATGTPADQGNPSSGTTGQSSTAAAFGTPVRISTAPGVTPQLAMDANGNAIAAWVQAGEIWANRFAAGAWAGAERVVRAPARAPALALAGGQGWLAWAQREGAIETINARRHAADTGWDDAIQPLSRHPDPVLSPGSARTPRIATDATGRATAIWIQERFAGEAPSAWGSVFAPGSGWSAPQDFRDAWSAEPSVVMDGRGNAVAAWTGENAAFNALRIAQHQAGVGWSGILRPWGAREVSDREPQLAANANGDAVAIWSSTMPCCSTSRDIHVSHKRGSDPWTLPQRIELNDAVDGIAPQIAMDASGNAVAVWQQAGDVREIWTARFAPATGWSDPQLLQQTPGAMGPPQLALAPNGDALVAWWQTGVAGTELVSELWRARIHAGTWSFATLTRPQIDDVRLAIDANANGLVVWRQLDGIWAAGVR